jgi:Periplasmic binding protein
MKKNFLYFLAFFITVKSSTVLAQFDSITPKTYRIGIFAPLYLDSVFANGQYRYKDQMPKMIIPGLEFVEGAQMALDSIVTNHPIKIFVYDYKSKEQNINTLQSNNSFDSLDLMIGSAGSAEFKQLADIALKKNIPFISATYPNDGGITANPNVVILNATLNTHCTAVYNYIIKTVPTSKIVLFRKKGTVEDRIAAQLNKLNNSNTGKALLTIPAVMLTDSFTKSNIEQQLDSTRMNTIIAGTLDENYGKRLAAVCAGISKKYPITLIGMPNWDGVKDFTKPEFKNFPIYFPASYYNAETDKWSNAIKTIFKERTNGTAMDMVYKGFECTYYFINVLLKGRENFMSNINDRQYRVFTEYDIKPVKLKTNTVNPDYYENKKVYILKKVNGVTSKMN